MLRVLLNHARAIRHRMLQRKANVAIDARATSSAAITFWREHGRDWAAEASPTDLETVRALAARIASLPVRQKEAEVVSAFQKIWGSGFSSPAEALAWDGMADKTPAAAFVAFVEGASSAPKPA